MRQAITAAFIATIAAFVLQCGDTESLDSFQGKTELLSTAIADTFYFVNSAVNPDGDAVLDTVSFLDSVMLHIDSVRWMSEFPTGGPSTLSVIISGQISAMSYNDSISSVVVRDTKLEIETHIDDVTDTVSIVQDSTGLFCDTVLISNSEQSGVILPPQDSRLFVKRIYQVIDTLPVRDTIEVLTTLPLINPW